jgi:hypothetical protein
MGLRYHTKRAEILQFGLVRLIHEHFLGYLSPTNSDQFTACFVEPCGLAGRFEYNEPHFEDNFCCPKGPPTFFAPEKDLAQGAWIFTTLFFLVSIHINLAFKQYALFCNLKK